MTRITLVALALLTLGACAAQSTAPPPPEDPSVHHDYGVTEIQHKLKDGRTIICLIWDRDAGYDSGMSCDWDNPQ